MNNRILPVTDAIIGYLQKERLNQEKEDFTRDIFDKVNQRLETTEEDDIIVFIKREQAYNMLSRLKKEARIENKDQVWIYEQMVLNGYGYEIDFYSALYQEMLKLYTQMYEEKKPKIKARKKLNS